MFFAGEYLPDQFVLFVWKYMLDMLLQCAFHSQRDAWYDERCVADDLIKVEHLHAYRLHCFAVDLWRGFIQHASTTHSYEVVCWCQCWKGSPPPPPTTLFSCFSLAFSRLVFCVCCCLFYLTKITEAAKKCRNLLSITVWLFVLLYFWIKRRP